MTPVCLLRLIWKLHNKKNIENIDRCSKSFSWYISSISVAALIDRKQRRYLRLLVEHKGIDLTEATKSKETPSIYENKGETLKQKIINELKR